MIEHLNLLANQSLSLWETPKGAKARLINISENATYLVEDDNWKSILRIHRENYHSKQGIECELAWSRALNNEGDVITPNFYTGRNGSPIQTGIVSSLPNPRFMVMFYFVTGTQPNENQDLIVPFEQLGRITAKTHLHSRQWQRPQPFERLIWSLDTIFGANPIWGNWRDGPNVDVEIKSILQKVEAAIIRRLTNFGVDEEKYGLIHADMRLANLLIDENGTRLIDFDDCGMGWYLYDFATAVSFMEDRVDIPALKESWVKGYCSVANLSREEVNELDTFIMLRRLALLAWIGSHIEVPEAQKLAPHFAQVSADLGEKYLKTHA